MKKSNFIMGIALLGLSACSTVTIAPQGEEKLVSKANYEESKPFYLWGLSGEHHINVLEVCNNEEPLQMQSQQTFSDGLLGLITLGIYAPHTAKVWCPKESEK